MIRRLRSLWLALSLIATIGVAAQRHLNAKPVVTTAAQTQDNSQTQGNPTTKVWVNARSHVYHCPGTRWYGSTKNGEYMKQADAQKSGNRPAYGKVCR
jgi:hypothetical protein